MSIGILDRMAGAPITWGVDGSPGWGHLMDPDRVLAEMAEVGLKATELGPDGYLGASTEEVLARLHRHGLRLVGGFVPVVLYDDAVIAAQFEYFERAANTLVAGGARVAVLGADSHLPGYDVRYHLGPEEWDTFVRHLAGLRSIADRCGIQLALHPHWGMAVERQTDVDQVIDRSDVGFCLDTGHLALAEVDIPSFIARTQGRVHHVHLKDLDPGFAKRVRAGDIAFRQAVIDGMFKPLGEGGVDIAGTILALEASGFQGWYVLEQDVSLVADPAAGEGPIEAARRSFEFLRTLADESGTAQAEATG